VRGGGAQPAASCWQGRCRPDSADWLQLLCIEDSRAVLTGCWGDEVHEAVRQRSTVYQHRATGLMQA
jgi:hypothetical protein